MMFYLKYVCSCIHFIPNFLENALQAINLFEFILLWLRPANVSKLISEQNQCQINLNIELKFHGSKRTNVFNFNIEL